MNQASPLCRRAAAAAVALCALVACGKKGPPLAPLRPLPGPVTELTARRLGDEVRFRFTVPASNLDKSQPVSLERIEVYAVTVAADAPAPANRDLLTPKYLVATIPVKPAATDDEPADPPAPAAEPAVQKEDPRPAPGEVATFAEELNAERMKPQIVVTSATPGTLPATTTEIARGWAANLAAMKPSVPSRIYVFRGVSAHGRPGQQSERAIVPLTALPAPPSSVAASFTLDGITLAWQPPAAEGPLGILAPAPAYNVYAADGVTPLNPKPLTSAAFARAGVTFGTEECFVVRSVVAEGNVTLESAPSAPACVTPADTFPPAAPTGLSAVATAGAVNLIWEGNTESDLAGYIVLRGEAPGDKLQAITATPITTTTYRDATAVPGVRYVYAVVAVDRASPPNTSPQSTRVEETAR